jgi:hypothetical protein
MLINLLNPILYVFKAFLGSTIVDKDYTISFAEEVPGDIPVTFLARRVPDLYAHIPSECFFPINNPLINGLHHGVVLPIAHL